MALEHYADLRSHGHLPWEDDFRIEEASLEGREPKVSMEARHNRFVEVYQKAGTFMHDLGEVSLAHKLLDLKQHFIGPVDYLETIRVHVRKGEDDKVVKGQSFKDLVDSNGKLPSDRVAAHFLRQMAGYVTNARESKAALGALIGAVDGKPDVARSQSASALPEFDHWWGNSDLRRAGVELLHYHDNLYFFNEVGEDPSGIDYYSDDPDIQFRAEVLLRTLPASELQEYAGNLVQLEASRERFWYDQIFGHGVDSSKGIAARRGILSMNDPLVDEELKALVDDGIFRKS